MTYSVRYANRDGSVFDDVVRASTPEGARRLVLAVVDACPVRSATMFSPDGSPVWRVTKGE